MPAANSVIQQPYDLLPSEPQEFADSSAFVESYSPLSQPLVNAASNAGDDSTGPNCCDICIGCSECCCDVNYRSGWFLALDASALQSQMATRDVDIWPDDFGAAGRITLGYEWNSGLGIRSQAWAYSMNGLFYTQNVIFNYGFGITHVIGYDDYGGYYPQPVSVMIPQEIELSMATAYLDFYKAINSRTGELLLGVGPAFGHLEFNTRPWGDGSKYAGGGVSVFGEGSHFFLRRPGWGLGVAGKARFALLTGDWHVDPQSSMLYPTTQHSKSMSIAELGVGPEFRRQFGRSKNHYWFVRALAEYQQWHSDRMAPPGGDTLALHGATLSFGANW